MGTRTTQLLLGILLILGRSLAGPCVPDYNTTSGRVQSKLNVHLVPHTHDDVGWLKTVDQYYYGSRQDIQAAGVQYILDTVIPSLLSRKDRTFIYGEIAFFVRWWYEQSPELQQAVKQLVSSGRLEFVNGGYVQHDEAAAHYVAMIDQTTRGHRWLNDTFGVVPSVGWQIDPFGHSATHASLMCGYLGFNALFFGRADYQDMDRRRGHKQLELLWRGAQSYGTSADVFTGNFADGNYNPPPGFDFDWNSWDPNAAIQDNQCLEELNVQARVEQFVQDCQHLANMTQGNDIMLTMGTDFTYSNAWPWFKNMDKLIHYTNLDGRINAFYSTPSQYVAAKNSYNAAWPLKTDDFFPYADCPTCYWTGYFTSRAASKGWIRSSTSFLQAVRQLEVLSLFAPDPPYASRQTLEDFNPLIGPDSDALEEVVSLLQHHDAITGTEKQHVANDYHRRLQAGLTAAQGSYLKRLGALIGADISVQAAAPVSQAEVNVSSTAQAATSQDSADVQLLALATATEQHTGRRQLQQDSAAQHGESSKEQRPVSEVPADATALLNVSICGPTVELSRQGKGFWVAVHNSLAWPRQELVRVPIKHDAARGWNVTDPHGQEQPSQIIPISNATQAVQAAYVQHGLADSAHAGDADLAFLAQLPPLGYVVFQIQPVAAADAGSAVSKVSSWRASQHLNTSEGQQPSITAGSLQLSLSPHTGQMTGLTDLQTGAQVLVDVEMAWYNASDELGPSPHERAPPSGAYIFRPNGELGPTQPVVTEMLDGPLVHEIRLTYLPWASATIRVVNGLKHAEVEWTAGPIPIEDKWGKELVIRYQSNLDSGDSFSTDANGREMQARIRNYRPTWDLNVTQPVAGNYYPLTSAIYLEEPEQKTFAVVTDRAQGGGSLKSGQLEVMLHRRTLFDDWRGVGEPLNETLTGCWNCDVPGLIVRGSHYMTVQEAATEAVYRRTLQQRVNDPVVLTFGELPLQSSASNGDASQPDGLRILYSALQDFKGLPANVHLLTLKNLGPSEEDGVLLRLAHIFEAGEKAGDLAQPAQVDLQSLFRGIRLTVVQELSLSAAKPLEEVHRLAWQAGQDITKYPEKDTKVENLYQRPQSLSCTGQSCTDSSLTITLQPFDIRTFRLSWAKASGGNL